MQPASRASFASARERLDGYADTATGQDMTALGEELSSVAAVLDAEPVLRRRLADSSASAQARSGLIEALFGQRVQRTTMDTLTGLASSRWSRPLDLVDTIEQLAWQATFAEAERGSAIEEVEDELFRFGRIVLAEPRLAELLTDRSAEPSRRVGLLGDVLGNRVHPVTRRLLEQVVRIPRGRQLAELAEQLVQTAAARRDRYVAHVTSPVALSDEQENRLVTALGRIYNRQMTVQVELDPELLGGLVIRVGDEVIDGSIAGRLRAARLRLPH